MKVSWTAEQQQVISLRDRNILVSAAAGSGKTAVLVERILSIITDPEHPVDVDRLLVVTFTRAAAGEMKERLIGALEKRLEEKPQDEHLQRQSTLVHHAQITTIDGFCSYVVRNYFHRIDLDPAFRMMEEGEGRLMRADAVLRVLEEAYEKENDDFLNFVECFASGRDDGKLEDLILNLYEFAQSYPFPAEWLHNCSEQYRIRTIEELNSSLWMRRLLEYSKQEISEAESALAKAIALSQEPDGPYMYQPVLEEEFAVVRRLRETESYEARRALLVNLSFGRLSSKKDEKVSVRLREKVKQLRDQAKEILVSLQKEYYMLDEEGMLRQMHRCRKHAEVIVDLTLKFAQEYSAKKRSRNLLDFSDLEHFALNILMQREDGVCVPTDAAKELSARFYEILIDEYQDSNYVQEMLLNSVSRRTEGVYNIFMVGDVKQSIYRFRQARPELFLEKYKRYSKEESLEQKIDLHRNFRSRAQVLLGANYIFRRIMTSEMGGIAYDDDAALYPGAAYPNEVQDPATEILLVPADSGLLEDSRSRETARELEARAVGNRIREMVGKEPVLDKETGQYRPMQYRDCVILLRATAGWAETFVQVLGGMGIPAYSASKTGYFSALEVVTVLNYLNICDNPMQEIPFTAVLYSPIVGCSAEELARIKAFAKELPIYEACRLYAAKGADDALRERLNSFFAVLEDLRCRVGYTPVHELVELVLDRTGYGLYAAAMPGGEQREANLNMLVEQAIAFEGTSYRGLFNFIRYIEKLQKYQVDYGEVSVTGENADTVRIMSIHKSKGLEFPVVFAAGMGKRFNQQDSRQMLVLHSGMGVGMDDVDPVMRTRMSTLPKQMMKRELKLESLAEELRILYVALTRAKERLILTGTITNLEKKVRECADFTGRDEIRLPVRVLENASGYWDWILPALAAHPAFLPLYQEYQAAVSASEAFSDEGASFSIRCVTVEDQTRAEVLQQMKLQARKQELLDFDTEKVYDEHMARQIQDRFSYRYEYENLRNTPVKMSVSELKREGMEEAGTELFPEEAVIPLVPEFMKTDSVQETAGAVRGTAYHRFLECLDFTRADSAEELRRQTEEWVWAEKMQPQELKLVDLEDILTFASTALGQRMRRAQTEGRLYREQPFVIALKPAGEEAGKGEDEILVQGIIDAYFEEDGSLILLDYKTDHVANAEILAERYRKQLDYYQEALERMTGMEVREKLIYSVNLAKVISV